MTHLFNGYLERDTMFATIEKSSNFCFTGHSHDMFIMEERVRIVHLQMKISKATNRDKPQLKKEVFIAWEQPHVLSAYSLTFKRQKKQLAKWNVTVAENDNIIHVINQMYKSNWLSEKTMIRWE